MSAEAASSGAVGAGAVGSGPVGAGPVSSGAVGSAVPRWIPPMRWSGTFFSFGAPALVLFVTARVAVPAVSQQLGLPPVLWFVTFTACYVFAPLLVIALLRLRAEALEDVAVRRERLRFRALTRTDWLWVLGAVALASLASAGILALLRALGVAEIVPTFLANSGEQALAPRDLTIAWIVFGVISVAAQEVLWRGVYLPRQEQAVGSPAWIANAAGWMLFCAPLGWALLLALLPVLIAVPYVAQRRSNSLAGAMIHAGAALVALIYGQM